MNTLMKRSRKPYAREGGKAQVSLLLDRQLVEKLQQLADLEHRSRNKQVEKILNEFILRWERD